MAEKKSTFLGPVVALAVVIIVVVGFLAAKQYFAPAREASTAATVDIGGPFTLTDQDDKTVTDKDFAGRYMLVYFGYTYCPDVCPTSLSIIGRAMDLLAKTKPGLANRIQPIFITIDPARDTPKLMKAYVKNFYPRMIGLTGTAKQIATVAKEYKVYYAKHEDKDSTPESYLMDHSSITYVMGPDGKFVTHFGHGVTAEAMAKKLATLQ